MEHSRPPNYLPNYLVCVWGGGGAAARAARAQRAARAARVLRALRARSPHGTPMRFGVLAARVWIVCCARAQLPQGMPKFIVFHELPRRFAKTHFLNPASDFSYVYSVFGSKFRHFSHSARKINLEHAFKAKSVTFRERNIGKWKRGDFCSIAQANSPARWKLIFQCFFVKRLGYS